MNVFFVYLLFRPNGVPCYVGKGSFDRIQRHFREPNHKNKHLLHIIKKAGGVLPFVILHQNLEEDVAFLYEKIFIKAIGRADKKEGPLVNLTDGGDGPSGMVHKESTKKILAEKRTGKKATKETGEKVSKALKGRKKPEGFGENVRQRLLGGHLSEETKRKISEKRMGQSNNSGYVPTEEAKEHLRKINTGKRYSLETKAKQSVKQKAAWARRKAAKE